jgi:hypothetical protein
MSPNEKGREGLRVVARQPLWLGREVAGVPSLGASCRVVVVMLVTMVTCVLDSMPPDAVVPLGMSSVDSVASW